MSSQTVNIPRDTTLQDTNSKLQAIAEIIGGNPMIAEKFSTESSYAAGEYCINDGEFEKFTAAKTAGAWDASKATETTVGEELTALNSTLALLSEVSHLQIYRFWNSKTSFTFDVGFTPTGSDTGTYLFISRENIYLINISDNDNITITLLHGTNTASISMSGTVVTITTAGRLWGSSFIIGIHRYS